MQTKFIMKIFLGVLLGLACLSAEFASAEELESSNPSLEIQNTESFELWKAIVERFDRGQVVEAIPLIDELNRSRLKFGQSGLKRQSVYLLKQAEGLLVGGDLALAKAVAEKAAMLSPLSLEIRFGAQEVLKNFGEKLDPAPATQILSLLNYDPEWVVTKASSGFYPFLWAHIIACVLFFVFFFTVYISGVLSSFTRHMPTVFKGWLSPFIFLAFLIAPLFLGPMWSILIWSFLFLLFAGFRKWPVFAVGSVLIICSAAIPLRENLNTWLKHPGGQSVTNILSGGYDPKDVRTLKLWTASRPTDGALYYALGVAYRKSGEYQKASEILKQAEYILGRQPWTLAQSGLVSLLQKDYEEADKLFKQAEDMGLSSAAFFFNYSKIKFALMDSKGSSHYYKKAKDKSEYITSVLSEYEQELNVETNQALGELPLPLHFVIGSALLPVTTMGPIYDAVSSVLMPGTTPITMLTLGIVSVLAAFFFMKPERSMVSEPYYRSYRVPALIRYLLVIVPGGSLLLRGKLLSSILYLVVAAVIILPLTGWPTDILAFTGGKVPALSSGFGILSLFSLLVLVLLGNLERRS